jgi:WD40 repeat protein
MKVLKDKMVSEVSESEIIAVAYDHNKRLIATSAFEEPVSIRKYPYVQKVIKKIVKRAELPKEIITDVSLTSNLPDYNEITDMDEDNSKNIKTKDNSGDANNKGPILTPNKLIFVNNGDFLVIGYANGDIRVYDTQQWKKEAEFSFGTEITTLDFLDNESALLIIANGTFVHIIDLKTWKETRSAEIAIPNLGKAVLSKDMQNLFIIADRKSALCLDFNTLEEKYAFKGHKTGINSLQLSPNNEILATSGNDGKISLFNANNGDPIGHLLGHNDEVHAILFSPNNEFLISFSEDETFRVWDVKTFKCIRNFPEVPNVFEAILKDNLLVIGNVNGEIRTFQVIG